ncbi:PAS domain-containing sensor histidine kinase, partial [Maricaulis sp. CAU 1757]
MNQMRFDTRPTSGSASRAPYGSTEAKPRSPGRMRQSGAIWIILAVILFTIAYGGILLVKIQQERATLVTEAERSQANAAGYLAERVSARIAEARYALSFASADLADAPVDRIEEVALTRLEAIAQSDLVSAIALLLPDGRTLPNTGSSADLRPLGGLALDAPSGLAASITEDGAPGLVLAVPVQLRDGTVGAFVARLDSEQVLPDWGSDRVVALANADGSMLSIRPQMNSVRPGTPLAQRFGLEPAVVDRLADGGGGATS